MIKTILGPPGCGKTHTNTLLIRQCIEDGIYPERIACVSFTKKAAQESKDRVFRDLGVEKNRLHYFQTLHSMAFRAGQYKKEDVIRGTDLKAVGDAVGISFNAITNTNGQESDFSMLGISPGDQYLGIYHLGRNMRISTEKSFNLISNYKLYWEELKRLIFVYEKYKKINGKVDFTDMIETFINRNEPVDIDALFVDEAQDLSTLQWDMVDILRVKPKIQIFTGDDDQAIMGFQGADVKRFLNATKDKEVLSKSYRLPQEPWFEAQRIVSRISGRAPKEWSPRDDKGSVQFHQNLWDLPLDQGEWCIMTRTNRLGDVYARMLRDEGWVYSRHGHPSVPIKTFQAILDWEKLCKDKVIDTPGIKSIYNFMSVGVGFKRGFGPRSSAIMQLNPDNVFTLDEMKQGLGLLADENMRWHQVLDKVDVESQNYILNALKRGDNVKNPRIKISTIHSMKGGECDNILVVPDLSPAAYKNYYEDPDTEHRVFYVAVTRAKKSLHFLEPQSNMFYQI